MCYYMPTPPFPCLRTGIIKCTFSHHISQYSQNQTLIIEKSSYLCVPHMVRDMTNHVSQVNTLRKLSPWSLNTFSKLLKKKKKVWTTHIYMFFWSFILKVIFLFSQGTWPALNLLLPDDVVSCITLLIWMRGICFKPENLCLGRLVLI